MAAEALQDKEPAQIPDAAPGADSVEPGAGDKEEVKSEPDSAATGADPGAKGNPPGVYHIVNHVNQTFHSADTRGADFGVNFGPGLPGADSPEPRMYGRLAEAEVAKVTRTFAEPPCHAEAIVELASERVVILGRPGGDRTAGGRHRHAGPGQAD